MIFPDILLLSITSACVFQLVLFCVNFNIVLHKFSMDNSCQGFRNLVTVVFTDCVCVSANKRQSQKRLTAEEMPEDGVVCALSTDSKTVQKHGS